MVEFFENAFGAAAVPGLKTGPHTIEHRRATTILTLCGDEALMRRRRLRMRREKAAHRRRAPGSIRSGYARR